MKRSVAALAGAIALVAGSIGATAASPASAAMTPQAQPRPTTPGHLDGGMLWWPSGCGAFATCLQAQDASAYLNGWPKGDLRITFVFHDMEYGRVFATETNYCFNTTRCASYTPTEYLAYGALASAKQRVCVDILVHDGISPYQYAYKSIRRCNY